MPQALLPAIIGGVASIGGSLISGHNARGAARDTRPTPYAISGPAGGMTVNGNNIQLSQANSPWASLIQRLGMGQLGSAAGQQNRPFFGASPDLVAAYRGMYGQGLTSEIQNQYDLLSQMAAPGENRDRLALDDQSYARGMLGTSGGAERFRALTEAQNMADLQRQQAAVGLGQTNALNRFQAATGVTGQGMAGQQQAFNIGNGAFGMQNQLLQQLLQQAGLGVSAGGGQAPGAAMYAAQQSSAPWQAGFNFLQQTLPGMMNGGGGGYGMPPMVSQPNMGPINIGAPNPSTWMPSVPGF